MMKLAFLTCLGFALALAANPEVEEFASSSNQFTGDIYNELLVNNNDNLLVSPFSLETILALTQSGAVGDTGAEIRSTLHLPSTREETDDLFKKVLPSIHNERYTLHTANKIYVEKNYPINEDFQKVATSAYEASFQNIDFSETAQAVEEINHWIEEQTKNKIHDLVTPDDVNGALVVLINALYFEANWTLPFVPQLTQKSVFHLNADEDVEAEMMFKESEHLNYAESEELDATILELPFGGEDASMVIVLPRKAEGIAVLEKKGAAILSEQEFTKQWVQVTLPKFSIESTIDFNSILADLGITSAFSPDLADFSGIAGNPGDIVIGRVAQKTLIDVNEIGVVAAAASVVATPTDVAPEPDQIFTVDHPFVFYIKVNGIVLFEGRVLTPKAKN